jgi:plasmid replication initiation protein
MWCCCARVPLMKITKSNRLIEARYHLKLHEQRIILASIAVINPKSDNFPDVVTVTALDLIKIYGIDQSEAYKQLQQMSAFLRSNRNAITLKDTDTLLHECVWVSRSKYYKREGRLELSFSPDIKKYLTNLKQQFTTYDMKCIAELGSIYSIRLYELMAQFSSTNRRSISVKELREVLMIPDNTYKLFSDFRKTVIEKSIKELKAKSNMDIHVKYLKTGKSITSLHFFFEEKAQQQLDLTGESCL